MGAEAPMDAEAPLMAMAIDETGLEAPETTTEGGYSINPESRAININASTMQAAFEAALYSPLTASAALAVQEQNPQSLNVTLPTDADGNLRVREQNVDATGQLNTAATTVTFPTDADGNIRVREQNVDASGQLNTAATVVLPTDADGNLRVAEQNDVLEDLIIRDPGTEAKLRINTGGMQLAMEQAMYNPSEAYANSTLKVLEQNPQTVNVTFPTDADGNLRVAEQNDPLHGVIRYDANGTAIGIDITDQGYQFAFEQALYNPSEVHANGTLKVSEQNPVTSVTVSNTVNIADPNNIMTTPDGQLRTINVADPNNLTAQTVEVVDPNNFTTSTVNVVDPNNLTTAEVKVTDPNNLTTATVNVADPNNLTTATVDVADPNNLTTATVQVTDPNNLTTSSVPITDPNNYTVTGAPLSVTPGTTIDVNLVGVNTNDYILTTTNPNVTSTNAGTVTGGRWTGGLGSWHVQRHDGLMLKYQNVYYDAGYAGPAGEHAGWLQDIPIGAKVIGADPNNGHWAVYEVPRGTDGNNTGIIINHGSAANSFDIRDSSGNVHYGQTVQGGHTGLPNTYLNDKRYIGRHVVWSERIEVTGAQVWEIVKWPESRTGTANANAWD